jgi:hypothetical protein
MPSYRKGERVRFSGEVSAELFGLIGVVLRRRNSQGHYVYDVQINGKIPAINLMGVKLEAKGILTGVPSDWIELIR